MEDGLATRRQVVLAGAAMGLLPACVGATDLPELLVWEKLPTEPYTGKQDDIAFGSVRRGWFGNGKGRLYRTDDGGEHWSKIWERPGTFIRALGFLDERHGIMGNVGVGSFPGVEDTVPLYRTADGGASWTPAAIEGPVPKGICAIELARSTVIDRGHSAERAMIHAAGRVGGPAHYLRSTDGGASWKSSDLGRRTAAIFDVKFVGPHIGFLAGSTDPDLGRASGQILRTDDGGETWHEVFRTGRPFETVWKLHFPSDEVGYATIQSYDPGSDNRRRFIAKSEDGGRSWREIPLIEDVQWRSFAIGFANECVGWVGGATGGLETRDGGASWKPAEIGLAVNKIRFVGSGSQRRAFAIGSDLHRLDLASVSEGGTRRLPRR